MMESDPTGNELGQLLRTRRERTDPTDVGLPPGGRRRTPGLRREEVAQLAGVSVTYYTFLEQGRAQRPSADVVDALAAALRLNDIERRHLRDLAYTAQRRETRCESLDEPVRHLVARLDPSPTYVKGASWDILAANPAALALFQGWDGARHRVPNMLRWMLLDPFPRDLYVHWEVEARGMLARFRAARAARVANPRSDELLDQLLAGSPEAANWWRETDVARIGSGHKQLQLPGVGMVDIEHAVLHVGGNPEQHLVTFAGATDHDTELLARSLSR